MADTIPVDVDSIVEAKLVFRCLEGLAFNVLHYRLTNIGGSNPEELPPAVLPTSEQVLPSLAEQIYNDIGAGWSPLGSNTTSIIHSTVQLTNQDGEISRLFTYTPVAEIVGGVAGNALPMQNAPTFLKRTIYGGRRGYGRLFFVGVAEASQANGVMEPVWIGAAQDFANKVRSVQVVASPPYLLAWRPVLQGTRPDGTITWREITTVQLSDKYIKMQKRRRAGKGI
jgi:hypothetical protein